MSTVPTRSRLTRADAERILALARGYGEHAERAIAANHQRAAQPYFVYEVGDGFRDPAECRSATPAQDGAR